MSEDALRRCTRTWRVVQQRHFDAKPLAEALCWQCGKVLWSKPDLKHTCLMNPPHGLSKDDAPASAYLWAVPDCNLTFIKPGREDTFESDRWYCCSYCHTHQIPLEFHVGDVFSSDPTKPKPVVEWDMQKPEPVAALRSTYETGQVSQAGLFSTAVRDAGFVICGLEVCMCAWGGFHRLLMWKLNLSVWGQSDRCCLASPMPHQ